MAQIASLTISDYKICKYIGTTIPVTFKAAPGSYSYSWTVPEGVHIISGQGTDTLVVDFYALSTATDISLGFIEVKEVNVYGCYSILSKRYSLVSRIPALPSSIKLTYNNVLQTKVGSFVGNSNKTLVLTATDISNTAASYLWQLPDGVNVVSGDPMKDKEISINFAGVGSGTTDLVFSVNAVGGCGSSEARTLTVSRELPIAPSAILLTNNGVTKSTVGSFIGTNTILQLTATDVKNSDASYQWILPEGVNVVSGDPTKDKQISINFGKYGNGTDDLVFSVNAVYGSGPSIAKTLTVKRELPAAPSKVVLTYNNVVKTNVSSFIGDANKTLVLTATDATNTDAEYLWSLPDGVNVVIGDPTKDKQISINFGLVGKGTDDLVFSVNAVYGTGNSIAKTLTVKRELPIAPTKVVLTYNDVAKTNVSSFVGDSNKILVLTATDATNTDAEYQWNLPDGVNVVSGDAAKDKQISINFGSVGKGTDDLNFSVIAVYGSGPSIAKTLTVKRNLPNAPSSLTLTNEAISSLTKLTNVSAYTGKLNATTLTLTATPNLVAGYEATSYQWVLPSGVGIVDASANLVSEASGFKTYTSISNVIRINLTGVGNATSMLMQVYALNACGASKLAKNLTLTSAAAAKPGTLTTLTGVVPTYHPSCNTITVKVPNVFGVTYSWSVESGSARFISYNTDGNEATIDVSKLPLLSKSSFKIGLTASNGTGSSSKVIYTINLGTPCVGNGKTVTPKITTQQVISLINTVEEIVPEEFNAVAYPNPSNDVFNVKVQTSDSSETSIKVCDMTGRLIEQVNIATDSVQLGSQYPAGFYNIIVNQGGKYKILKVIKN